MNKKPEVIIMAWVFLISAGMCEAGWAIMLKLSNGFTKPVYAVMVIVFMVVSVFLAGIALKSIPVGTAYAVWTGTGIIMTAVIGMFFMNEPRDIIRIACIFLIITGIVGLRVLSIKN
jgi:quaternary ammonium compound-resistance protein SugE